MFFIKEYSILIRQGEGKPYILQTFNDIDLAKIKLYDIISLEELRNRPYFVDNDFFNNNFSNAGKLKYLCIIEREVSEWKTYSEELQKTKDDNILYFNNYKRRFLYDT